MPAVDVYVAMRNGIVELIEVRDIILSCPVDLQTVVFVMALLAGGRIKKYVRSFVAVAIKSHNIKFSP